MAEKGQALIIQTVPGRNRKLPTEVHTDLLRINFNRVGRRALFNTLRLLISTSHTLEHWCYHSIYI